MNRIGAINGLVQRGYAESDMFFTLESSFLQTVTPGVFSGEVVIKDIVFDHFTSATVTDEATVIISSPLEAEVTWDNATPEVASFDSSTRKLTWVSNGTATISATVRGRKKAVTAAINQVGGLAADAFNRILPGTLRHFADSAVRSMVAGKTASSTTRARFLPTSNSDNLSGEAVTANPDLFCAAYAFAFTGHSERMRQGLNGYQTSTLGGILITPQHVVCTSHQGIVNPGSFYFGFRDTLGVLYWRTVLGCYYPTPGLNQGEAGDVVVYVLDSPLPATVKPLLLPPQNILDFLTIDGYGCLSIFPDRESRFNIALLSLSVGQNRANINASDLSSFYDAPISGTSSKPTMIPLPDNKLMAMTQFSSGTTGPSHHFRNWAAVVSAADAAVGVSTGYVPTIADLSAFTNFSP